MKLALKKDMAKVRADAKLRMRQMIDAAFAITSQDLAYLRKERAAQAFLYGVEITPNQLKSEAELRGVTVGSLARSIAAKAHAASHDRNQIETLRIKHGLRLTNAQTEIEAKAIVDAFALELNALKPQ